MQYFVVESKILCKISIRKLLNNPINIESEISRFIRNIRKKSGYIHVR